MTRRSVPFRIADVTRACKGALAAGLVVKRVEVFQDGKIVMGFDESAPASEELAPLDRWLEAQNAKAK